MEIKKIRCEDSPTRSVLSVTPDEEETQIFQYKLNNTRTKRKIHEGSLRPPYQRENKKGSIVLIFSDGAFKQ